MDEDLYKEMMRSDQEVKEMMKNMTREESLAYFKDFYQKVMDDPVMAASLPAETLDGLRAHIESYEKAVTEEKIAHRNAEIAEQQRAMAQAKFDRIADEALNLPTDEKGN
jgi:hypothetical protein